jgi:hypothetical protein
MNKIITLALAITMFVGCKKSENDPGLSFRSRDKKMVGEWSVLSYENVSEIKNGSNTTKRVEVYDGSKITLNTTFNGTPSTPFVNPVTYTGKLTLEKDGKCIYVETSTNGSNTSTKTLEGNWMWGDSKRNKTIIAFTNINGTLMKYSTYIIDELRNDKLVLKIVENEETNSGTNTNYDRNTHTVTLGQ